MSSLATMLLSPTHTSEAPLSHANRIVAAKCSRPVIAAIFVLACAIVALNVSSDSHIDFFR
jgi:hypothetical protein